MKESSLSVYILMVHVASSTWIQLFALADGWWVWLLLALSVTVSLSDHHTHQSIEHPTNADMSHIRFTPGSLQNSAYFKLRDT
ncbi:hypothetical protein BKA82DRAFT_760226 [Pisolithus tinctorius]|uniref:Uncharacterized protein n=1 Tax=Pisolithus tinctorius Marx 270 TaxID=870435 RepID=A0A0C3NI94_PISTI|nr:hypothetical protein BKA82DRAFT_760226 [Pisolithus tinctorius]KIO00735.1 hypothetical protein M404DRAFT_760226 [Pisolithus tinctorius Marx 270]